MFFGATHSAGHSPGAPKNINVSRMVLVGVRRPGEVRWLERMRGQGGSQLGISVRWGPQVNCICLGPPPA